METLANRDIDPIYDRNQWNIVPRKEDLPDPESHDIELVASAVTPLSVGPVGHGTAGWDADDRRYHVYAVRPKGTDPLERTHIPPKYYAVDLQAQAEFEAAEREGRGEAA